MEVVLNKLIRFIFIIVLVISTICAQAAGSFRVRLKVISYNDKVIKVRVGKHLGSISKKKLDSYQLEECIDNIGDVIVLKVSSGTINFK